MKSGKFSLFMGIWDADSPKNHLKQAVKGLTFKKLTMSALKLIGRVLKYIWDGFKVYFENILSQLVLQIIHYIFVALMFCVFYKLFCYLIYGGVQ